MLFASKSTSHAIIRDLAGSSSSARSSSSSASISSAGPELLLGPGMLLEDEALSSLFFSMSMTGTSGLSSAFSVQISNVFSFWFSGRWKCIAISIGDLSENAECVKNVDRCHHQVEFRFCISNFIQQLWEIVHCFAPVLFYECKPSTL